MHMLAIVTAPQNHDAIQKKLERHFSELQNTGFTGDARFGRFGDVLLAYDASSPYAFFTESSTGFHLWGGFRGVQNHSSDGAPEIASYAGIILDDKDNAATLRTEADPNYPWPLFYASTERGAAIGSDVHAIAIALGLSELSLEAVSELISYQYVLGRSTTVEGINRLWPGEELSFSATASALPIAMQPQKKHASPDYVELEDFDLDKQVDETFESLVEAVKQLNVESENTVVQLSGGLDSRLTAIAISRSGASDVNCITMNLEDGKELAIAGEITSRYGFAHETLTLPESGQEDLRAAWLLTAGQAPLHAAANNIPYYRSQLKNRDHVRIVGAWPADLLIGAFVPNFSEFADPRETKRALKFWLGTFTENLGAEELFRDSPWATRHIKQTRKRIAAQVSGPHGSTAAQRVSYWAYTYCAPVFTFLSPARMCANVLEIAPVMAPGFVQNLLRLRGKDIQQRNFYQRMIWAKAPELQDIPYHNTGKLLSPEYDTSTAPMSWKLRAMLAFPLGIFRMLNRMYNRRLSQGQTTTLSVQSSHWNSLLSEHTKAPLTIANGVTLDPRVVTNPFGRIGISATAVACAWTRSYLKSYQD
ncbi:asparagine synthase-related protein [Leucobacter sp. UT-8R-CII-1-4]|uniref:asparagine synthase-related protein n=1 Tax=Leucobacter sp. UT-8R-CII-1-4 TaxID=3040075 RepID=UPI0024A7B789|nr:asparagine synthase-related protein [Leucobacter sp. UT-8R-CII-1-4]MDI6023751.1 asparagine synthase-related protein [Leucobacter sp. UT-8R-CII-1-4]